MTRLKACMASVCLLAMMSSPHTARAQAVADFYKRKTVTIVVGSDVGGGYDLTARTLAHHLARHIPGQPSIIVQNKPGASSIVADWAIEARYGGENVRPQSIHSR